jgi:hypothetical protein
LPDLVEFQEILIKILSTNHPNPTKKIGCPSKVFRLVNEIPGIFPKKNSLKFPLAQTHITDTTSGSMLTDSYNENFPRKTMGN